MWDLVGNPEDRFSRNEAHMSLFLLIKGLNIGELVVSFVLFCETEFYCTVVTMCA